MSCLKDRIWLNHEITNATVELPTAGHRTQDAAFRCHIPVCLTEHQHQQLLHKSLGNASAGKSADHSTRNFHSSCLVSILISFATTSLCTLVQLSQGIMFCLLTTSVLVYGRELHLKSMVNGSAVYFRMYDVHICLQVMMMLSDTQIALIPQWCMPSSVNAAVLTD